MLSVIMLNAYSYSESDYAEYCYVDCRGASYYPLTFTRCSGHAKHIEIVHK